MGFGHFNVFVELTVVTWWYADEPHYHTIDRSKEKYSHAAYVVAL
jgi:hypothetical protein